MPYGSGVLQPGVSTRSDVHRMLGTPFFVNNEWQIEISKDAKEDYYTIVTYDKEGYLKSIEPGSRTNIPYRYDYRTRQSKYCFSYRFYPSSGNLYSPIMDRDDLAHITAKPEECILIFMPRCEPSRAYIDDAPLGLVGWVEDLSMTTLIKRKLTPGDHTFRSHRVRKAQDCSFELDFTCEPGETVFLYGRGPNFFGLSKRAFVNKSPARVIENAPRFVIHNDKQTQAKLMEDRIDALRRRAQADDAEAQLQLYYLERRQRSSLKWLCRAADQGQRHAQNEIASLYWKGDKDIAQDLLRAYVWYSIAVRNGYEEYRWKMEKVAESLTPEQTARAKEMRKDWQPGQCERDLVPISE
jgi:TPR repeat protein